MPSPNPTPSTPSGSFRAGRNSRAQVNAQNMTTAQWSATFRGENLDTTNFESNGYEEGIIGIWGLDWSLSGSWNAAQNPNADPPGLFPTEEGSDMFLYVNVSDDTAYEMSTFRCTQGQASTTATGKVEFTASGMSQGSFTVPTGQN